MSARDLLAALIGAGLTVSLDGAQLVIRPASLLTDALRDAIRAGKVGLLAVLSEPQEAAPGASRPHKLTAAQLARGHASPWDDASIARFEARAGVIRRRGYPTQDAEDLAERLHVRDVDGCGRVVCLECANLAASGRCAEAARLPGAGSRHEPERTLLMRCEGFRRRADLPAPGAAT